MPTPDDLVDELRNFEALTRVLKPSPGNLPKLPGIDIYGVSMPLKGSIGGDHTIYIDFKQRYDLDRRIAEAQRQDQPEVAAALEECRQLAGVLLADVSGHRITDALIAAMLHQAFLLGAYYELDRFGRITSKLFEHINQRFFRTTGVHKYLTMIYGEISAAGTFRFISAAHPAPRVFSRAQGCFVEVSSQCLVTHPPVGMFASNAELDERVDPGQLGFKKSYTVNELDALAPGDMILLYTDGLSEHAEGAFSDRYLEPLIERCHDCDARTTAGRIQSELLALAEPEDDISFVVIQRHAKRQGSD